jgi:predicted GH43/DUF377 family glycosyl hydrolase
MSSDLIPDTDAMEMEERRREFFASGYFEWQKPQHDQQAAWDKFSYSVERWWGSFPADIQPVENLHQTYPWAIGPFNKYAHNPILGPTRGAWDGGHFGGGVHNGAVLIKDGLFYYVYRGEREIDIQVESECDYICDIGVATSEDGIHFTKREDCAGLFRQGEDRRYSYEDVNIARHGDTYYLFCNQWYWDDQMNTRLNGVFLATSHDLIHWDKMGIVFPDASRIHRNGVVLQSPQNEAIRVDGKFWMYINDNLMATSTDMVHWESFEISHQWPGGEGCFALGNHDPAHPDDVVLFTGGNHTGNFYAVGEVLFSKADLTRPLDYLPQPVLTADPSLPYENGFSVDDPTKMISGYSDCIFFNGVTRHHGRWWVYYGGSEYYTCLAHVDI